MSRVLQRDYRSLFIKKSRVLSSKFHVFYIKDFDRNVCKVTVKKRVGNAVIRNFYKRRLRVILNGLNFKKKHLVLGVVLYKHQLDFENERQSVVKVLKPLVD